MSIGFMDKVFKDISLDSTKKLIMLSLADNANDEGYCYPSQSTIVKKTSLSKPTVIKHLNELEFNEKILSKKRSSSNGGRNSTIYLLYPLENIQNLDEDLLKKFDIKSSQSKEALLPPQSKASLPEKVSQSKEALPKPSPSLFNHHLFNKLNKDEKEIYLEYLALRKAMKLKTTMAINERLLSKYFEYGRDIELIRKAINSNWRDFYPLNNFNNKPFNQNTFNLSEKKYEESETF